MLHACLLTVGKDQSVVLHQQLLLYPAADGGCHEILLLVVVVVLACMHPDGAPLFVDSIFITFLIVGRCFTANRGVWCSALWRWWEFDEADRRRVQSVHQPVLQK